MVTLSVCFQGRVVVSLQCKIGVLWTVRTWGFPGNLGCCSVKLHFIDPKLVLRWPQSFFDLTVLDSFAWRVMLSIWELSSALDMHDKRYIHNFFIKMYTNLNHEGNPNHCILQIQQNIFLKYAFVSVTNLKVNSCISGKYFWASLFFIFGCTHNFSVYWGHLLVLNLFSSSLHQNPFEISFSTLIYSQADIFPTLHMIAYIKLVWHKSLMHLSFFWLLFLTLNKCLSSFRSSRTG